MKNLNSSLVILLLSLGCSSPIPFTRSAVGDALQDAAPPGTVLQPCYVDTDGDGTMDAIDPDCSAGPIDPTPIDPGTIPPEPPAPGPDPVVRLTGDCVMDPTFVYVDVSDSNTYSFNDADLNGATDLWIHVKSNGVISTVDLNGATTLKRVFMDHQGGSNRINLVNADVSIGFCNEISGGSNKELFDSTNSGQVADLTSGTGNKNKIDIAFTPTWGINYALSGSNNCVSATNGTTVQNGSGNTFIQSVTGTDCFTP